VAYISNLITFTTPKDVHIKLGLKSMKVLNLQIVVGVKGKASHIAESKATVVRGFGTVERVAKGLVMGKS